MKHTYRTNELNSYLKLSTSLLFTDPCSTFNCHHMCINTPSGPKCLCSEGFDINKDNKTCIGGFFIQTFGKQRLIILNQTYL